jgi:hypothetical protein
MINALQVSAAGLLSSANRAALAAQNIIAASQPPSAGYGAEAADLARGNNAYQQAAGVAASSGLMGRLPASFLSSTLSSISAQQGQAGNAPRSLEEEIVNLKKATAAYKANAAVFKAINNTIGTLLEIKS